MPAWVTQAHCYIPRGSTSLWQLCNHLLAVIPLALRTAAFKRLQRNSYHNCVCHCASVIINRLFSVSLSMLGDHTTAQTYKAATCMSICAICLNQDPWTEVLDTLTGETIPDIHRDKLHGLEMHRNHSHFWFLLGFWVLVSYQNQVLSQIVIILKTSHMIIFLQEKIPPFRYINYINASSYL